MNLEDTFVKPSTTLYEAFSNLESRGCKLIIIVNESRQILGILTDGDLRKLVLNNQSLDVCVSEVMNKNFYFISSKDCKEKGFSLMKKYGLTHIPILDEKKVVLDILSFDQFLNDDEVNNTVVIMAGGKGMRLRPFTNNCPKPMLKINGVPILEIIIKKFEKQGFKKFFISVNYLKDQIINYFKDGKEFGIKIQYLIEDMPLGTAGALKLIDVNFSEPLIIMNGDLLTEINFKELINFHKQFNAEATMTVAENEYSIPYGVVQVSKNELISFKEKPTYKYLINAGIYIINHKVLDLLNFNEYSDMPELLEKIMNNNGKVAVYNLQEYWLDIGNKENYNEAYRFL